MWCSLLFCNLHTGATGVGVSERSVSADLVCGVTIVEISLQKDGVDAFRWVVDTVVPRLGGSLTPDWRRAVLALLLKKLDDWYMREKWPF